MATGIIGRKLGMTRMFNEDGTAVPVTVIEAGPCQVLQVRDARAQLGYGEKKCWSRDPGRARSREGRRLRQAPQIVRTFPINGDDLTAGSLLTVEQFAEGDMVKVTGTTKGRGFQGVVKRHGFAGGPGSHGNTRHRRPGSISPGTDPSRVIKGKKMPGHHGAARHTELGLTIVRVDSERNLLFVRGAVPGSKNGIVIVAKQGGKSRHD